MSLRLSVPPSLSLSVSGHLQSSFNPAQNPAEHLDVISGRVESQKTAAKPARQIRLVPGQDKIDQSQNLQRQLQRRFGRARRGRFSWAGNDGGLRPVAGHLVAAYGDGLT